MLTFVDSTKEIFNSKAFGNTTTAGKHIGLSTVYIKHILFHQSKHEVEGNPKHGHRFFFQISP